MSKTNTLWVESSRPETLDKYIGNEGVKAFVAKCIKENDIPHMLLWGRPGTGKTTLAKLIVKNIKCDVMYINASDERGIDVIREKIVDFASVNSFNPLKVVILDESDYITSQGLAALRNIMETYSEKTRFILTANYVERISDPIKSRCQTFHIEPPTKSKVAKHVAGILDEKKVTYELEDLASIIKTYYPDIRRIINTCQQYVDESNKLNIGKFTSDTETVINLIINQIQSGGKKAWSGIRQILADNEINDYILLYTGLYERAEEYTTSPADVAIYAAQYMWQNNSVADRELNFMAFISQILKIK